MAKIVAKGGQHGAPIGESTKDSFPTMGEYAYRAECAEPLKPDDAWLRAFEAELNQAIDGGWPDVPRETSKRLTSIGIKVRP